MGYVMSEVQVYTYEVDDGVFAECVLMDDFDAQRLRADMAEGALEVANRTVAMFADDLQVAEQRIADLTGLLQRAYDADLASRHCQPYNTTKLMDDIEATLNPKPEAGSHE
jgi:hypothetical protein